MLQIKGVLWFFRAENVMRLSAKSEERSLNLVS